MSRGAEPAVSRGEKKGGWTQIFTAERLRSFLPSLARVQVACGQGDNDNMRTEAAVGQPLVTPRPEAGLANDGGPESKTQKRLAAIFHIQPPGGKLL